MFKRAALNRRAGYTKSSFMPPFLPVPVKSIAQTDLATLFPAFPGTKDIRLHPVFKGGLSKWAWRLYTHRFTRAGRWFAGLTLFMLGAVSPSLDIQSYIPLSYACGLWGVTVLAVVLNRPRVGLRAFHAGRIAQNEILPVSVDVTAQKRLGTLEVNVLPARLPLEIDEQTPGGVQAGSLAPGETQHIILPLTCKKRGQYVLRGFRVESDFPFGLMNAYREYRVESPLLVVPAYTPLTRLEMPQSLKQSTGSMALATHLGDSLEFLGNREFREGDNLRDIDWRATARLGGVPVVREYREEYFLRVGLLLDTYTFANQMSDGGKSLGRKARKDAQTAQAENFERAVSLCAAAADYLTNHDYVIDFFGAGPDAAELTAQRNTAHLEQILDILATVSASDTDPLPVIEPKIQAHLSGVTSVVCVFLRWNPERAAFVQKLRAGGVAVKSIVVSDADVLEAAPESAPDFVQINRDDFASERSIW